MVTVNNLIAELKSQHPSIKIGDDVEGYSELNAADYEAKIKEWAEAELAFREKQSAERNDKLAKIEAKKSAISKLQTLGLSESEIAAIGFVITEDEQAFLDELKAAILGGN
jgi:hypothetical protein